MTALATGETDHADLHAEASAGDAATAARTPQQARGKARVETILDAAAALVVAEGLSAITMHKVAKLAKTPIGSMYHFFPDKETLVTALRNRHKAALEAIDHAADQISTEKWQSFTPTQVIDAVMSPYIDYLERNLDCLVILLAGPTEDEKKEDNVKKMLKVIDARVPHAKPEARRLYAEMIQALAVGCLGIRLGGSKGDMQQARRYLHETKRALTAYLSVIEATTA